MTLKQALLRHVLAWFVVGAALGYAVGRTFRAATLDDLAEAEQAVREARRNADALHWEQERRSNGYHT